MIGSLGLGAWRVGLIFATFESFFLIWRVRVRTIQGQLNVAVLGLSHGA